MSCKLYVIKVGGSLLTAIDLRVRLTRWLNESFPRGDGSASRQLLVPGGGGAADWIRSLDRRHDLGEERSHWMALQASALNAPVLAAILSNAIVVDDLEDWLTSAPSGEVGVLNPYAFALRDEQRPGRLPHRWEAASDCIAARAAQVAKADELILLKSTTVDESVGWDEAGRRGWVDPFFAKAVDPAIPVRVLNLREW